MNHFFVSGRWCRCAFVLLTLMLLASCLTGGGRFQQRMCEGGPLYDEPVFKWQASDGVSVPYSRWLPPKGIRRKGLVIAVPGMDESSNEVAQLGRHLSARGYEVYSSDLRGQGKDVDSSERGNYHRWRRWVEDVNEFAAHARDGRKLPIAYMGHSLGGMVALSAASAAQGAAAPDALMLYAPAFVLAFPPWYDRPAVTSAQLLTLNFGRVTGPALFKLANRNLVSNEPDEAAWERSSDRLCRGFSFRYISVCFDIGQHARKLPGRICVPVLLQYGKSDATIAMSKRSPEKIRDMFQSRDTELWWHPDARANHDMLNDHLIRKAMLEKTSSWLDQRLAK
jgi:alpha-beta hydrolase superfamily lysophospholipase